MASLCPRSLSGVAIRDIAPSGRPPSILLQCLHHTARPHATRPSFHSYSETHHLLLPKFSCSSSSRHHQSRTFTSYPARLAVKTVQQARARQRSGPFSAAAAIVFFASGAGLVVYFRYEKARMERKRIAEATKGVGKPKIGGTFDLVDQEGRGFGDGDMKGGFSIVYFGFTHCPDICPEELDKLAKIIDLVSASSISHSSRISSSAFTDPAYPRSPLLPLFITCDPARDTPAVLKTYLKEFHPGIVGLTGTWEQVKDMCKKYRVYFSTPEGVKPGMDYLVDHSIYFYLMDPDGDFVEAIGRQHSAERAAQLITEHMSDWRDGKKIR